MSLSDAVELALLNQILGGTARAVDATVYIGLSTTDPGETGSTQTEPAIGTAAYARVAVTNNATNWPSGNPKSNGTVITFPTATADWLAAANFTHFTIWNSPTATAATNFIGRGTISTPKPVRNGDTASFAVGALTVTMD